MLKLMGRISAFALLAASVAFPAAIDLRYTGVLTTANISGTNVGDTITLDLTVDNGGTDAISQTWNYANFQGFTISTGTYNATYSKVYEASGPITTDASGIVTSVTFYGTSGSSVNSDNFNTYFTGDFVFGGNNFMSSQGVSDVAANYWSTASNWTVVGAGATTGGDAPEPSTITMLLGSLGMLGVAVRKSRRA